MYKIFMYKTLCQNVTKIYIKLIFQNIDLIFFTYWILMMAKLNLLYNDGFIIN